MSIQVKAIEQNSPVVLFVMLYEVVLAFESVDEALKFLLDTLKFYYYHLIMFLSR